MPSTKSFRPRCERLFKRAGIASWYALAKICEIDTASMYAYRDELKEPGIHAALRIAAALNTSAESLWG